MIQELSFGKGLFYRGNGIFCDFDGWTLVDPGQAIDDFSLLGYNGVRVKSELNFY